MRTRRRGWGVALAGVLAGLALVGCGGPAPAPTAEVAQPRYDAEAGLAAFDRAWERIGETYFDQGMEGLDWDAVRAELRPEAAAANTPAELRHVIDRMMSRLEKSHFEILPPGEAQPTRDRGMAWVGLDVRSLDGAMVVTTVAPGSPADEAGVRPGWILEEIDGGSVFVGGDSGRERLWARQRTFGKLLGQPDTYVDLRFRDAHDEPRAAMLRRVERPGESIRVLNLPEYYAGVETRHIQLPDGGCVGYLHFGIWMLPVMQAFQEGLQGMADCDGVVLDLRGNLGGVGAMARGIAGFFVQETGSLGQLVSRQNTLNFNVQPRPLDPKQGRGNYAGPLAILTDAVSVSTTEIFAAGMQELGRAKVFGETSAGMALPAMTEELPTGDVLMHAIADFTTPAGHPVEGRGVIPDFPVDVTRESLLQGGDPVLDAAVEWIATQEPEGSSR